MLLRRWSRSDRRETTLPPGGPAGRAARESVSAAPDPPEPHARAKAGGDFGLNAGARRAARKGESAGSVRVPAMRALTLLVAAVLFAPAIGCGQPRVNLSEGPREYVATDYEQVLARWTRTEHLIALSELDDLLTVTATFESWDFRWAYVVRYAQDYRLTTEQRRLLLESTLDETRAYHQFYVALYGANRRFTDLSKPDAGWVVRLFDDRGNETAPDKITPIPRPGPIERTYFPYTSPWRRAFRIRFPATTSHGPTIAPDARIVGLRFAGAQGSEELRWYLDRGGRAGSTPF